MCCFIKQPNTVWGIAAKGRCPECNEMRPASASLKRSRMDARCFFKAPSVTSISKGPSKSRSYTLFGLASDLTDHHNCDKLGLLRAARSDNLRVSEFPQIALINCLDFAARRPGGLHTLWVRFIFRSAEPCLQEARQHRGLKRILLRTHFGSRDGHTS